MHSRERRGGRLLGTTAVVVSLWSTLAMQPCTVARPRGAETGRRRMHAYRLDQPIELDGAVREEVWMGMEPATGFVQQMPSEGAPSSEKTEVRVAYDERTIYIGVICFDREPDKILVTQSRRDGDLVDSDSFQILLDTFGDRQNAFVFSTNPRGIEYDGQVTRAGQTGGTITPSRGTPPSSSQSGASAGPASSRSTRSLTGSSRGGNSSFTLNWDGVWEVRAQVTERGWEAEFAIPFKTLRFNASSRTPWGINFMRNIRRRNEQALWAPISRAYDFFRVSLAGEVEGIEPRLHRSAQVIPYLLAGVNQNFLDPEDPTDGVHRAGIDVKYTLTSSLALDATYNTDFAQVEVDEEQVNLTRFNLFFPEKRPFFLENSGMFEFGTPREVEIFFSRRIGIDPSGAGIPIVGGGRVTGKIGKFSVGLLDMQTERVDDRIPANNFSVGRVRREFGRRSGIGVIFVGRNATGDLAASGDHNETYGIDANIGLGEHVTLFSFLARSQTPGRLGRAHAGRLVAEYASRLVEMRGGYSQVGEDFNPEVGFLRRSGFRKPEWGFYFNPRPKWGPIRRLSPHSTGEQFFDFSGSRQSGTQHHDFRIEFNNGSEVSFARNLYFERLDKPFNPFPGVTIPAGRYPFAEWSLSARSDPSAPAFVGGNFANGPFYDGTLRTTSLDGGFRRGSSLVVGLRYLRNDVRVLSGDYVSHLASLRVNYSFSSSSYVQSFVQYNNQTHQVSGNFRFAYILTAATGLFVVYNTHLDTLSRAFGEDFQRRTQDRVFLVKFSYLFGL